MEMDYTMSLKVTFIIDSLHYSSVLYNNTFNVNSLTEKMLSRILKCKLCDDSLHLIVELKVSLEKELLFHNFIIFKLRCRILF